MTALLPLKGGIHTLTHHNGKEFVPHEPTDDPLGSPAYFAHPHHSWESGLNGNTNGFLRQYFLKRADFGSIPDGQVREFHDKPSDHPRKCLG